MNEIDRLTEENALLRARGEQLDFEFNKMKWQFEVLQDAITTEQDISVRGAYVMRSGSLRDSMAANRSERTGIEARINENNRLYREEQRFDAQRSMDQKKIDDPMDWMKKDKSADREPSLEPEIERGGGR